jgi:hypothetical protein
LSLDSINFLDVEGLSNVVGLGNSLLVPCGGSLSALVLELADQGLLSPSDLAGKVTKGAELSEAGQLNCSEGIGDELSLLGVIGGGNSLEDFESAECLSSSGGLMGQHASDGSPEYSGGGTVVYESSAGVSQESLSQEF